MKASVIILPHAGGASHAYRDLAQQLAPHLEACCHDLPGHGRRTREPLQTDMEALALDLLEHTDPSHGQPWVLFGHSMGALLAHAFVRLRRRRGLSMPAALFVSGAPSPTAGQRRPAIAHLPSALFWEQVRAYGGVPEKGLQSAEFREYFEGILRNDFDAVEGYAPPADPIDVPLHVLYGREDITDQAAQSWRHDTSAGLRCHAFDGGHFYLFERTAEVGRLICDALAPGSADRGRAGA